ncbi:hypothetical protein C8R43DRAFT_1036108 [Mycena crocata]|nr:hypothetical protein C8R43DRAFT_1036108 [Mycena crocata]
MSTVELRRQLAQLDALIGQHKQLLAGLERDRLDVERELHASATFPVVELPIEITTEIFLQCLGSVEISGFCVDIDFSSSEYQNLEENDERLPRTPITLFGVCRHWRDVVLSTPALWSTVRFWIGDTQPDAVERYVEHWLDRAGSYPLSLSLSLDEDEGRMLDRMRGLISRHSSKIQRLELLIVPHAIQQLGLDTCFFPLLRWAHLGRWRIPQDPGPSMDVFVNAPLLGGVNLGVPGNHFSFPWLQLTRFDGQIDRLDMFSLAPNLTEAKCLVDRLLFPPPSIVTHTHLQSLILVCRREFIDPVDILEYLTLPTLQSLHISGVEETVYATLNTFLRRSSPPLQSLSIRLDDAEFHDWEDCFISMRHTLQNLEAESICPELLLSLIGTDHGKVFPNLRTLTFMNPTPINYLQLAEFLWKLPKLNYFQLSSQINTMLEVEGAVPGTYDLYGGLLASVAKEKGIMIKVVSGGKTYVQIGSDSLDALA